MTREAVCRLLSSECKLHCATRSKTPARIPPSWRAYSGYRLIASSKPRAAHPRSNLCISVKKSCRS